MCRKQQCRVGEPQDTDRHVMAEGRQCAAGADLCWGAGSGAGHTRADPLPQAVQAQDGLPPYTHSGK